MDNNTNFQLSSIIPLLAEYDGWVPTVEYGTVYAKNGTIASISDMKYLESLDWIIPVLNSMKEDLVSLAVKTQDPGHYTISVKNYRIN